MREKKYAAAGATTHKYKSSAKVRKKAEVCKYKTNFNLRTWQTKILF